MGRFAGISTLAGAMIFSLGMMTGGGNDHFESADWKTAYPGLIVVDGHTHDLVPRGGAVPHQGELRRALAAGLNGVILSFPLERTGPEGLVERIRRDLTFVQKYAAGKAARFAVVGHFDFVSAGAAGGQFQVLPSLEYFDGVFGRDPAALDVLYEIGIRSITLADFPGDNLSQGKGDALRLSEFGRRIVGRMNELGMAIDISHLPEPLQRDVIRTSRRPVIASHSNARTVASVGRNISDEILKDMGGRGGMVCLTLDREFLFGSGRDSASPGMFRLLKHIEHVVGLCGVDHVGIGTDFLGSGENAPADLGDVGCFEAIAEALSKRGCPAEDVGKILGGNLVRFFSGGTAASYRNPRRPA